MYRRCSALPSLNCSPSTNSSGPDRCHKGGMPLSEVDDRRLRDVQVMAARHQKDIDTLGMESKMARGDTSVMDEFHHDIKAVKADIHSLNEKVG